MRRRTFLLAAAALLATASGAEARMHAPYRGHRIVPSAVAPQDKIATPSGAYSFRKLKSTYAGPAVRIRRASDNAETDINFLGCTGFTGCPIDTAAATAHCAATSCTVVTWYDQSGNARHATKATAADQPVLVFNCLAGLPCLHATLAAQQLVWPTFSVPVMPVTFSAVANRATGTDTCYWGWQYGANGFVSWIANNWATLGGTGGVGAIAADATWHAGLAIFNGASSLLRINATETTGTVTGSTVNSVYVAFNGPAASTGSCRITEGIRWDGYAPAATDRAALQANQKSFWGTP